MSSKQLLRLAIVLAVVLAAWAAAALANRSARTDEREHFLPPIDTATIDTIALAKGRDTILLVRSGPSRWTVNGYPADPFSVRQLLRGLVDSTTTAELVAVNPSSHLQLGVSTDSARRVRVASRGQTIIELLAGKRAPDGAAGVYVRRPIDPQTYLLRGPLLEPLTQQADDWHERTITTIPIDSVDTIEIHRGRTSYTLQRGNGAWTFASGAPADSAGVANLLARYRTVTAVGFATKAQGDSLHFDSPSRRVRLVGHNGKLLASFVFDSITSGVWLRHDSGGPAYHIDSWTAPRMTPGETALRQH